MARPGISYDQIAHVCDTLVSEGVEPGPKLVRERLGTGSPNTIQRLLAQWRATRPTTAQAAATLPDSIALAIQKEIEQAAAGSRAEVEGRLNNLANELADLAEIGEGLEGQVDTLTADKDMLSAECDKLAIESDKRGAEVERLAADLAAERSALGNTRQELATVTVRSEMQAQAIAEMAKQRDEALAKAANAEARCIIAERDAAVAAAKNEALTSERDKLASEVVRSDAHIEQLQVDLVQERSIKTKIERESADFERQAAVLAAKLEVFSEREPKVTA